MTADLERTFLSEYSSHAAVLKYTRATAGYGIGHLLQHDYLRVYADALSAVPEGDARQGLRILEFGCGGGMNLMCLVSWLIGQGGSVERALGTDFSAPLIEAAHRDAVRYLRPEERRVVEFHVARNEALVQDLGSALSPHNVRGKFHLALGINTIRYCHRTRTERECVRDIHDLLAPGGVCVVIDMNDRFKFFRSSWSHRLRRHSGEDVEYYLPSLEEHAAPFAQQGFEVLRKEHFCWIPHSAGRTLCSVMRATGPLLNAIASSRAMRSLVVARKPRFGSAVAGR